MGWKEKKIINSRLSKLKKNERLFRINAGSAWTAAPRDIIIQKNKTIILKNARPFRGAPIGWPDLCGWESKAIASECCGSCLNTKACLGNSDDLISFIKNPACENYKPFNSKPVAIFKFEEVKATGNLNKDQKNFKKIIEKMGGIFKVLRD